MVFLQVIEMASTNLTYSFLQVLVRREEKEFVVVLGLSGEELFLQ